MNVNALIFERMDWIKDSRCLLNWYHDYNVCEILINLKKSRVNPNRIGWWLRCNLPTIVSIELHVVGPWKVHRQVVYTLTFKAIHVASWQMEEAFVKKRKNCLRTVFIKTQIIVKQQKYTIKTFLLHTCIYEQKLYPCRKARIVFHMVSW